MINLLPPQEKEGLLQEEKYRLILISGISVIIFLAAFSLVLFATKTYISEKIQEEKIVLPVELQDPEKQILAINKNLRNLNLFYSEYPNITGLLERISQIIPQGIHLSYLSFNFSEKDADLSVSLQGFSQTRELLFQLKKNLESETDFEKVDFPASNWVKPRDIEFSSNFKVKL